MGCKGFELWRPQSNWVTSTKNVQHFSHLQISLTGLLAWNFGRISVIVTGNYRLFAQTLEESSGIVLQFLSNFIPLSSGLHSTNNSSSPSLPGRRRGPPSHLIYASMGLFPWRWINRDVKPTSHLHLVTRLKMVEICLHSTIHLHDIKTNKLHGL
jgi:hypothetical protein